MQRKRDWPGEEADIAMVGFLTYGEKNTFYMKEPARAHRCQLLGAGGCCKKWRRIGRKLSPNIGLSLYWASSSVSPEQMNLSHSTAIIQQ